MDQNIIKESIKSGLVYVQNAYYDSFIQYSLFWLVRKSSVKQENLISVQKLFFDGEIWREI